MTVGTRRTCVALLLVLVLAGAAWALQTSPTEILANPDAFDGRIVTLRGMVGRLQRRVSRRGNAYFTFELSDGRTAITVFKFGESPCRAGVAASVEGLFQKVKQVGRYTFRNQVDADRITC